MSQFFVTVANIFIPERAASFFIIAQESILPLPAQNAIQALLAFHLAVKGININLPTAHFANPAPLLLRLFVFHLGCLWLLDLNGIP